jgi:RNA polymerase sigma-B factor
MQTYDPSADFAEYRRTHDPRLREALVRQHAGLAYAIARRYEGRGEERDDPRQVALFALAQSIERFDPDRGVQFSTFAAPTITGNLKRHLRDHTWLVRPPRAVNERALAVADLGERLTRTLQRPATTDDIAAAGGWDRREVEDAISVLTTHRLHERVDIDVPDVEDTAVADDAADDAEPLLAVAATWAHQLQSRLRIVTVCEPVPADMRRPDHFTRHHGPPGDPDVYLAAMRDRVADVGLAGVDTAAIADPVSVSAGLAASIAGAPAGLLVVGSGRHGDRRLGGLVRYLLPGTTVPLLVVNRTS